MTIYGNKMMTELTGQTSQPGTQTSLKAGKEEGRHIRKGMLVREFLWLCPRIMQQPVDRSPRQDFLKMTILTDVKFHSNTPKWPTASPYYM